MPWPAMNIKRALFAATLSTFASALLSRGMDFSKSTRSRDTLSNRHGARSLGAENPFIQLPKCPYSEYLTHSQNVELDLTNFVHRLKVFVSEINFRYLSFEKVAPALSEWFSEIATAYRYIYPRPQKLTRQLIHVQVLFETMMMAKDHLTRKMGIPEEFHGMVAGVFELRLATLTMLDSHGQPDSKMHGYPDKVAALSARVTLLGLRLAEDVSVPPKVRSVMWIEFYRAESTLKTLLSGLPNPERVHWHSAEESESDGEVEHHQEDEY